jgi:hypothetical protein
MLGCIDLYKAYAACSAQTVRLFRHQMTNAMMLHAYCSELCEKGFNAPSTMNNCNAMPLLEYRLRIHAGASSALSVLQQQKGDVCRSDATVQWRLPCSGARTCSTM